ncbi:uncharacterized protein BX664DRAFT_277264 [Halteromyces radiatus]|uniref:uncharacterized protein n=1 Tax=Halteromyces radiatus TaxID=101107 RepID=UPI00221ED7F8|nr:uncharacterized protein BX664DRAFT_277264 [Halteromyces radiatus]KAI8092771.1 hypothetical protein BX664DRAFT_277264 [Halteromyces radiatus]
MYLKNRLTRIKNNFNLHEVSGSLGDLGTFLPIMISLAIGGQINLTSTLWFTGIWNILSGVFFQVPVCVQPMKAVAAVVLSSKMTIEENMAAGIGVGAIVFFLGVTRTINLVGNYTPIAVIRGIQMGTGFSLIQTAYKLVNKLSWEMRGTQDQWADNYVWVLLAFLFVFSCYNNKVPSALILFLIGLIFAFIQMYVDKTDTPRPFIGGYYPDTIIRPSASQFRDGFVNAGLGQIPLTALNSVIGLCALIDDLFPDKHAGTSEVSMSVGVMNIVQCWFGAMPLCHGAGGLAGQYRFGARSEVSIIILGLCKLLLGILFGSSLVGLLDLFPKSILAVMLFVSAIELAFAGKAIVAGETDEQKKTEKWVVMLVTTGVMMAFSNAGIGFLAGLVVAALLSMQRLGLRTWFEHTLHGIRDIPQKWRAERDYATGRMLPTDKTAITSSPTGSILETHPDVGNKNQYLSPPSSSSVISLPHQPVPHTSSSS